MILLRESFHVTRRKKLENKTVLPSIRVMKCKVHRNNEVYIKGCC